MAAYSAATATHILLRSLLHRPLRLSTAVSSSHFSLLRPNPPFSFSLFPARPISSSSPLYGVVSTPCSSNTSEPLSESVDELEERENESDELEEKRSGGTVTVLESKRKVPNLTVKEKKELGSYANSLGDKLKSQQVGKSGVTDNVVFAMSENLESNELLKLKIHRSCPGELDDVVRRLEEATGSVAVGQIGRTVILYRPSITKLKAEEKKEQTRRLFAQKRKKAQAAFMMQRRDQVRRQPTRWSPRSPRSEKVPS